MSNQSTTEEIRTGWKLYYWQSVGGRGIYIRTLLEMVGAQYEDALKGKEDKQLEMLWQLQGSEQEKQFFAFPMITHHGKILSQTSAIALYIADLFQIKPKQHYHYFRAIQMMMQIVDCLEDAHLFSHPKQRNASYNDQKEQADKALDAFCVYKPENEQLYKDSYDMIFNQKGRLARHVTVLEAELNRYGNGNGWFYDEEEPTFIDAYVFVFVRAFKGSRPEDYERYDFIEKLKKHHDRFEKLDFWQKFLTKDTFPPIDNTPSFMT